MEPSSGKGVGDAVQRLSPTAIAAIALAALLLIIGAFVFLRGGGAEDDRLTNAVTHTVWLPGCGHHGDPRPASVTEEVEAEVAPPEPVAPIDGTGLLPVVVLATPAQASDSHHTVVPAGAVKWGPAPPSLPPGSWRRVRWSGPRYRRRSARAGRL